MPGGPAVYGWECLTPSIPTASPFNRVTGVWLTGEKTTVLSEKHTETEIWKNDLEDDRLYRVVTGMYSAQMLDTVKDRSFGLLSIVPKDERGEPVTDFFQRILRDRNGNEIKEWYALAAYLRSFGEKGVPNAYALSGGDGRKQVSHSWSPGQLLGHLNWIGVSALVLLALAAAGGGAFGALGPPGPAERPPGRRIPPPQAVLNLLSLRGGAARLIFERRGPAAAHKAAAG